MLRRCKVERRKCGIRGAGLNISIYGRHVWSGDKYVRVERASVTEGDIAFRAETRGTRDGYWTSELSGNIQKYGRKAAMG